MLNAHVENSNFDISAKYAILMDSDTGEVLFEKNADSPMFPSSMTKLMTVYMLFEKVKSGELNPSAMFDISKKAWKTGGSKMFLEVGKRVSLDDIIRGITIVSANDACVCASENIYGNEDVFVKNMNENAKKLGMKNTIFSNSHGLNHGKYYDKNSTSTARDLLILSLRLINDFPNLSKIHSVKNFSYNNIKQINRNPLLFKNVGCDFGKTGHTDKGGYGLSGSCIKNGRRIVFIINGTKSLKERSVASLNLVNWAFDNFQHMRFFKKGEVVREIPVWYGEKNYLKITVKDKTLITSSKDKKPFPGKITYKSNITAPIIKGDEVGFLTYKTIEGIDKKVSLIAMHDVNKGGFLKRLLDSIRFLAKGAYNE